MRKTIFILATFLAYNIIIAADPVSVPQDNPVYRFLDRMETLGIIANIRDGAKPFDRGRIALLLREIDLKRDLLNKIDSQQLDNYLLDFRYEIDRQIQYAQLQEGRTWYTPFSSFKQLKTDFLRFFQRAHPEEDNHVFLWEDSTNSFYFDFIADFYYDKRDDQKSRSANTQIYRLRGTIAENFGYALDLALVAIRGDEGYRESHPVLKDTWNQTSNGKIYFDRSGGELAYHTKYIDFRFAQQPINWGLGESGRLILSDYCEQYTYFNISKHWKWGTFTFIHGKLLEESALDSIDDQPIHPDKWIAAHRFEFSPWHWMSVGLTEMVIYGNRSPEWAYFIPFNFYRATEHNLRDRDNLLIAIDIEANILAGSKIYGTIMLDEFKQSKLFSDWWGNKFAYHLGYHLVDPFGLPNLSVRFEYAAIRPWVYTHIFKVNRYINYTHSLGHWAGPNSQVIYINLEKDWHWRFITGLRFTQFKHGDNYPNENIGGNILLGHNILLGEQEEARETSKFLEGILTTDNIIELFTRYEVFNNLFLQFSMAHRNSRIQDHTTNLMIYQFGFRLDY